MGLCHPPRESERPSTLLSLGHSPVRGQEDAVCVCGERERALLAGTRFPPPSVARSKFPFWKQRGKWICHLHLGCTFCVRHPRQDCRRQLRAVACDSYNRTKEDIDAAASRSAPAAYRFSISWSRIIHLGGRDDPINQKGIHHSVKFVDDLLEAGIRTPFITLFHWDLPRGLDKRYGGLLNKDEFSLDFGTTLRVLFAGDPQVQALDHLQRAVVLVHPGLQQRLLRARPHLGSRPSRAVATRAR